MKYIYHFLLILTACGCATLNKTTIENTKRAEFQNLVLIPDYDISDLRIDIIRQTDEVEDSDSTTTTELTSYHPIGFYLGDGMFIDLNDNLSLLVTKLFHINSDQNFTIKQSQQGNIFNSIKTYQKTDNLLTINNEGLINTNTKKIINNKDSIVFVKEGLFSKFSIIESDSSIEYRSGCVNRVIHKSNEGYFYKTFFGKEEYKQLDNEILIGKRYIIRNQGDTIEILYKGLLNSEHLIYRIIKSDDRIYVYDRNYRGLEISLTKKEIKVKDNTRLLNIYSIE